MIGHPLLVGLGMIIQSEHQILLNGKPGEDRTLLRNENALGIRFSARHPVDENGTRIRLHESYDHVQQRRFSTPRWADDCNELAVPHGKADVLDDLQRSTVRPESLADAVQLDLSAHSAT
jgi:hypothetical protein